MTAPAPDPGFRAIPDLIREHAAARPRHLALAAGDERLDYAALDALMDRVAAALQRDGCRPGDTVAICAHNSPRYAAVFLGALRAGVAVAPIAPSVTPAQFGAMVADAEAKRLFADDAAAPLLPALGSPVPMTPLDASLPGTGLADWLAPAGAQPRAGGDAARLAVQHHLFVAAPPARPRASCSRTACAGRM